MHKYEIMTHQVINSRKPVEDRDSPSLLISIVCLQFPSCTDWSILVCSKTEGCSEHVKFVHSGYECYAMAFLPKQVSLVLKLGVRHWKLSQLEDEYC